ncbi:MAG: Binding-protein-dependent transport system inner rane component [Anaerocolumna sp.]|jgi:spermidine/putrescine transport system permease protein|nr:Binding-protein-dependent transport system inner rane component [Anaerocolumna sp.]
MSNTVKKRRNTIPLLTTVSPVAIWLILLVAAPLLYVFFLSFMATDGYKVVIQFNLDNYKNLLNPTYIEIYVNSFIIAFFTTLICILLGYPFAYIMANSTKKSKTIMMIMLMVPFWTNSLIRLNGWKTILGKTGVLNSILLNMGVISEPLEILYTRGAVLLGMVYTLIPYMILPTFASIDKLDGTLLEASSDLGANKLHTFLHVTLPLTFPGIFSGSIMIFIPSLGFFFVSDIMGGGKSQLIGNLIENQFKAANNWPFGAALSMMLIALILIMVTVYKKSGGDMEDLGVM